MTTCAPSSTSRRAVSSPMPAVDPVTRQRRSRRPRSMGASVSTVTTILLVRHGETDWNRDRRVQGHSDTPLNETGRAQARALADDLARTTARRRVLQRPPSRARDGADRRREQGPRRDGDPRPPRAPLRHLGGPDRRRDLQPLPGGQARTWGDAETKEEMAERVLDGLERIAALHDGGRVLVVTHGGPVRAALAACGAAAARPDRQLLAPRAPVPGRRLRRCDSAID